MRKNKPSLLILGTRGIPAAHGGFETFAERLSLKLVERGWKVSVYCQKEVASISQRVISEHWRGVELLQVEVASSGPVASLEFDGYCARDAVSRDGICLVLGYNGAIFLPILRAAGKQLLTNMDGIEWKRPKWSAAVKAWFWVNERIAAWTSQRLVADHPAIADHIATRRNRDAITMIPYGGDPIISADAAPVRQLGLEQGRYLVSIARIEPDNSILTFVEAFSRRVRGVKLVVLGKFDQHNAYHCSVLAAASDEVVFPGAIYEPEKVAALRFHALAYLHGHTVGGTNPSLVESLWAGNAVIAHDNKYNRWTAGEAAVYFNSAESFEAHLNLFLSNPDLVARARLAARAQAARLFDWNDILMNYEREIIRLARRSRQPVTDVRNPVTVQSV